MTKEQAEILLEDLNVKIDNGLSVTPEINQQIEDLIEVIEGAN